MQATVSVPEEKRRVLGPQLEKLGVRLLNKYGSVLQCERCEATWSPERGPDGLFPHGFWRCPNRCNW